MCELKMERISSIDFMNEKKKEFPKESLISTNNYFNEDEFYRLQN